MIWFKSFGPETLLRTTPRPNHDPDTDDRRHPGRRATEAINSAATSSSFPSLSSLWPHSYLSLRPVGALCFLLVVRRPPALHCRLFQAARPPSMYQPRNQPTSPLRSTRITNGYKSTSSVPSPSSQARGGEERDSIAENGPARLMMAHPLSS